MHDGPFDPAWFRRLEEAFHGAQAIPDGRRAAWIAARVGDDRVMAERLERMLASAATDDPTLAIDAEVAALVESASGADRAAGGQLVGAQLGPYRLIAFQGEGGFGEVYLAEQREPIRRRVAIKVLRNDRARRESLGRFKGEVESLARLEHAGIARIYDAGEAVPLRDGDASPRESGRPNVSVLFIAMEFVDGTPITSDAAQRATGVVERLRLVAAVADAMQHAHQRGIIHRDIKPSNVLVTTVDGLASPKIIDFGIAKALAASAHEPSTSEGDRASLPLSPSLNSRIQGTPQYMSPEQADRRGSRELDTRTDIYSLGVILYELVTGERPVGARSTTPASAMVSFGGSKRTATPKASSPSGGVPRWMRADLERILRTATHPDRESRYVSAAAFADDLRRVEIGEPVSVGPATRRYRFGRFLRRNRLGSAAVAVAGVAILGGSIATLIGMLTAREQAARADAVNGFLEQVLSSVSPERRGADVPLSAVMDGASADIAARFAGQPLVEADVRLLIGHAYANLWRIEPAVREYTLALERYQATLGPDAAKTVLAAIRLNQVLVAAGKVKEVDAASGELLERTRRVFGVHSREAAMLELMRARIASARGRTEESEQAIAAADAWISREFAGDPELIGWLLMDRILILRRAAFGRGFDTEESKARFRETYDLSARLVALQRERTSSNVAATTRAEIELGRSAIDIGRYREALEVSERVVAESVGTFSACHDTPLDALELVAAARRLMGEADRALEAYRQVMECRRATEPKTVLAQVAREFDLIPYLDYAGLFSESESQCREVIELLGGFGAMGESMRFAAESYLARAISKEGRADEASAIFLRLTSAPPRPDTAVAYGRLYAFAAAHFASLGRVEEAWSAIDASFAALPAKESGTWQYHIDDRLVVLAEAYDALGDATQADACRAARAKLLEVNRTRR